MVPLLLAIVPPHMSQHEGYENLCGLVVSLHIKVQHVARAPMVRPSPPHTWNHAYIGTMQPQSPNCPMSTFTRVWAIHMCMPHYKREREPHSIATN